MRLFITAIFAAVLGMMAHRIGLKIPIVIGSAYFLGMAVGISAGRNTAHHEELARASKHEKTG
jgi:hypothetical protein